MPARERSMKTSRVVPVFVRVLILQSMAGGVSRGQTHSRSLAIRAKSVEATYTIDVVLPAGTTAGDVAYTAI
jgi:hypothetical protein